MTNVVEDCCELLQVLLEKEIRPPYDYYQSSPRPQQSSSRHQIRSAPANGLDSPLHGTTSMNSTVKRRHDGTVNTQGGISENDGVAGGSSSVRFRSKMVDWMFQVVDYHDMPREAVAVAMKYYDVVIKESIRRSNQVMEEGLLALGCSFLAFKLYCTSALISSKHLATLSQGRFTASDITDMEMVILHTLQWHVYPPIPSDFLHTFLMLMDGDNTDDDLISQGIFIEIVNLATFMLDLSVLDSYFVQHSCLRPSIIALAALSNAVTAINPKMMRGHDNPISHILNLVPFFLINKEHLDDARMRLWELVQNNEKESTTRRGSPVSVADPFLRTPTTSNPEDMSNSSRDVPNG